MASRFDQLTSTKKLYELVEIIVLIARGGNID